MVNTMVQLTGVNCRTIGTYGVRGERAQSSIRVLNIYAGGEGTGGHTGRAHSRIRQVRAFKTHTFHGIILDRVKGRY